MKRFSSFVPLLVFTLIGGGIFLLQADTLDARTPPPGPDYRWVNGHWVKAQQPSNTAPVKGRAGATGKWYHDSSQYVGKTPDTAVRKTVVRNSSNWVVGTVRAKTRWDHDGVLIRDARVKLTEEAAKKRAATAPTRTRKSKAVSERRGSSWAPTKKQSPKRQGAAWVPAQR
jgi:hypothetical protein